MYTFKTIILICSAALAPQDCQVDTATDVILGPSAPNEMVCGMPAQAFAAHLARTNSVPGGHYVKWACKRERVDGAR